MGNTIPNPTTKVSYLYESVNDIIMQSMYSSISKAECNAQLFQKQNIIISDVTLSNCDLNINQYANVLCNLVAFFDQNFNNPSDTNGAKILSFVNQTVDKFTASSDPVIKNFLNVVKERNQNRSINLDVNAYIKNSINQNINVNDFKSCSSSVFVVQDQQVIINDSSCKDGKININQTAIIQDYAKCIFGGILNAIMVEPSFRDILRTFNNGIQNSNDLVFGPLPDVCYTRPKVSKQVNDQGSLDPNIKLLTDTVGISSIALAIFFLVCLIIVIIRM
jgi:hypothetical protein